MTRYLLVLLLLGAILLAGCGTSSSAQQQGGFNSVQKGEVPAGGARGSGADFTLQLTVIRNEADWSSFWDLLYASYLPKPALPSVNFSENVVVALVDSQRATGGYSVSITDIRPNLSGITVTASQVSPGPACIVTQAFTQPFHIVTTPLFSGAATLDLTHSVNDCGQ